MQRKLLDWYDKHRRILPWREDPAPYHVWISEIMLQQTRVEAVKGYYARFVQAFPDVKRLAKAEEEQYLKAWEGLGYYSRVRNLHKAAEIVAKEYGGALPATAEELKKLPGIGPYTAAAVASIAFGEETPAIDGNLLRVFTRMTACKTKIDRPEVKKEAERFFLEVMREKPARTKGGGKKPARNIAGDCNQALMDLGATVCLPNAQPLCEKCPWQKECAAHQKGEETDYPVMPIKRARRIENKTVFILLTAKEALLHKRPERGLLAGLYEFPNTEGHLSEKEAKDFVRTLGLSPLRIKRLEEAVHIFTHKEWHMTGYEVRVDEPAAKDETTKNNLRKDRYVFANKKEVLTTYPIPSAFRVYNEYFRHL